MALFAHPDDEVAVLPLLATLSARRQPALLFWLTDGGFGGVDPNVRRAESLRVLRDWQIDLVSCRFVGLEAALPDGELHLHMNAAIDALGRCLADHAGPIVCFVPAWEGGHQDHDAVHVLGRCIRRSRVNVTLIQYPLYHGEGLVGPFFRVMSPVSKMSEAFSVKLSWREAIGVLRSCARYRSQWMTFIGLAPAIAWKLLVTQRSIKFFRVRTDDPCLRPHVGRLLYERRTNRTWEEICESVVAYW